MSVAVPWAPARKGEGGPAQVVCLGLRSPCRSCSGSNPPPRPVLTGGRNNQCGVAESGGVREPDPAGRRGRGGGPGAWGGAGARLPPPFIQPTVGAEGLGRPARHWERERAEPGLRGTPCAPATMSDPAVNAQLDGIISDFEGGCPTQRLLGELGRSLQAGLERDGVSTGEARPRIAHPGALCPRPSVAYIESPI